MAKKFEAVGFDFGGVIVKYQSPSLKISHISGVNEDELLSQYYKVNHLANTGNLSYEDVWGMVLVNLGKSQFV